MKKGVVISCRNYVDISWGLEVPSSRYVLQVGKVFKRIKRVDIYGQTVPYNVKNGTKVRYRRDAWGINSYLIAEDDIK